MTKILLSILVALLVLFPARVSSASGAVNIVIDGHQVEFFGWRPVLVDGRTFVPVRAFEAAGFFGRHTDMEAGRVTLTCAEHTVIITLYSYTFTVNGETRELATTARIINNVPMLPLGAVLSGIGFVVQWDEETRTVSAFSGRAGTLTEQGFHLSPFDVYHEYITSTLVTERLTTGKLRVSAPRTADGNEWPEPKEGFEWRVVSVSVTYGDENAWRYGTRTNSVFTDYYFFNLSTPLTEGLAGEEHYHITAYRGEALAVRRESRRHRFEWDLARQVFFNEYDLAFLVPVGYGGIVIAFYNAANLDLTESERPSFADVFDGDTLFFRIGAD